MKATTAAAVLMFALILSGCSKAGVSTAAVLVPSVEHPERFDVHLLIIASSQQQHPRAAVLYLPYEGIGLLLDGSPAEEGRTAAALEELLDISLDAVYRSDAQERIQAVRLLERLEGFDGELVFSYGRASEAFWELLRKHAGDLAHPQVLPVLGSIYDEQQVSESRFARGLEALAETTSPLAHIPLIYDENGIPFDGELLRLSVRQVIKALEGER